MIVFALIPVTKKYFYFCFILSELHINYPFKNSYTKIEWEQRKRKLN